MNKDSLMTVLATLGTFLALMALCWILLFSISCRSTAEVFQPISPVDTTLVDSNDIEVVVALDSLKQGLIVAGAYDLLVPYHNQTVKDANEVIKKEAETANLYLALGIVGSFVSGMIGFLLGNQ